MERGKLQEKLTSNFQPNGSAVKLLSRRFLADAVTPPYNLQSASTSNYPVLRINYISLCCFLFNRS